MHYIVTACDVFVTALIVLRVRKLVKMVGWSGIVRELRDLGFA